MEKEKNNLFFSTFLENIKSCIKTFFSNIGYMALLNHLYGSVWDPLILLKLKNFC